MKLHLKDKRCYWIFLSCVIISVLLLIFTQYYIQVNFIDDKRNQQQQQQQQEQQQRPAISQQMRTLFQLVDQIEDEQIHNHPLISHIQLYDPKRTNLQPLELLAYELLSYRSAITQLRQSTLPKKSPLPPASSSSSSARKRRKDRILCATFLAWKDESLVLTAKNIQASSKQCDWILFVYDGKGFSLSQMRQQFQVLLESNVNNTNQAAAATAKLNYEILLAPSRRRKEIIISTYKLTCQNYIEKLLQSMLASASSSSSSQSFSPSSLNLKNICSFIIPDIVDQVQQEDQTKKVEGLEEFSEAGENSGLQFNYDKFNHQIYPKVQLLILLLIQLTHYDYVWLLDNDILLENFNFQHFLHIHSCAFQRPQTIPPEQGASVDFDIVEGRPVVSQPLIQQSKAHFPYLSQKTWNQKFPLSPTSTRSEKYPYASTTGFVEIQVPFLQSDYLQWFILAFIIPMFQPMNILGADWGFDNLFCQSSKLFSFPNELELLLIDIQDIYQLSSKSIFAIPFIRRWITTLSKWIYLPESIRKYAIVISPFELRKISSCGVIIGGEEGRDLSVDHHDSGEIQSRLGGSFAMKELWNTKLRLLIQKNFPHFHVEGVTRKASPLKTPERYERIHDLDQQCVSSLSN